MSKYSLYLLLLLMLSTVTSVSSQSFIQMFNSTAEINGLANTGVAYTGRNSHTVNPASLVVQQDYEAVSLSVLPVKGTWPESYSSFFNEFKLQRYHGIIQFSGQRLGFSEKIRFAVGYGFRKWTEPTLYRTDEAGTVIGEFNPFEKSHDFYLSGAYVGNNSRISIGASGHLTKMNLGYVGAGIELFDLDIDHTLFDLGMLYQLLVGATERNFGWRYTIGLGASLNNLGSDYTFYYDQPEPTLKYWRVGPSLKMQYLDNNLTTVYIWPMVELLYFNFDDGNTELHTAMELGLYETVSFRIGTYSDSEDYPTHQEDYKQSAIGVTLSSSGLTKHLSPGNTEPPVIVELSYAKYFEDDDYIQSGFQMFQINAVIQM